MINLSSYETFNIVTIGSWNPAIFSPEWAKSYLADNKQKDVILAIPMQMTLPPRLTVDDINLYPSTNSLTIDCVEYGLNSHEACAKKLAKIASLLEHTPVTALGINFKFAFEIGEAASLIELFSFDDAAKIESTEYRLTSSVVKRTFILQDSTTLNLSVEFRDDQLTCEFNFHTDIKRLSDITDKTTTTRIQTCYDQAIKFIKTVYDIELNE